MCWANFLCRVSENPRAATRFCNYRIKKKISAHVGKSTLLDAGQCAGKIATVVAILGNILIARA